MLRKPQFLLVAAAALLPLAVLALPAPAQARVKLAVGGLFQPFFALVAAAGELGGRAAGLLAPREALARRLAALEGDNARLRLAAAEGQAARLENDRLRALAGLPRPPGWRLRAARVIGRDPANWWRSAWLDAGRAAGVTPDAAVLGPEGLVGRVVGVTDGAAQIVMLGDPNCPVAAVVRETGDQGIIRPLPGSDVENDVVALTFLPRNAALQPGQQVFTSGAGGVFPPGILVGEVVDFRAVGHGLYLEARVRLAARPGAADVVWVKLP
jgi:rod shape-determining protein MreC